MKQRWATKPLGDLCTLVGGGTPSKANPKFYGGEIPWATVRDMHSDVITSTEHTITQAAVKASATNIILSGNVIIATRVGLGKVCLLSQDTAINQDLKAIIPNNTKQLAVRYLFLWLKSVAPLIISAGTGATVQGVKLPFIKSLQIPFPSFSEQQRIIGILGETFDGIAKARANTQKRMDAFDALKNSILAQAFSGNL